MNARFKRSRTRIYTKNKCEYPEMEIELIKWFKQMRENNCCMLGTMLQDQARHFHKLKYEHRPDKQSFKVIF